MASPTQADPAPGHAPRPALVRGLGLFDATTIIGGSMIGSGIFVAPSIMAGYVGLFVLRRKRPDLPRPHRAWGYPVLPLLYIAISVFFLVFILKGDPRNSGLGLGLTALGLPAYLYWRRDARPS